MSRVSGLPGASSWKDFLRESVRILFDIQFLSSAPWVFRSLSNWTMWFHLLPQRGVVFHYLQIVVFMDWDKHLVGRSFFSHGHSNLNSIISPAYLEREKIHLLNTVFLFFLVSQRDAPSCNSISAAGHICLKYQSPAAVVVAMLPEGEGSEKDAYVPFRDGYQLRPHPFS